MRVEEGANMVEAILASEQTAITVNSIYRLSVAQSHAMIDAGILVDDDPVELLEGWLVEKMSKRRLHVRALSRVVNMLQRTLPQGWFVSAQNPISTKESEPEPDAAVVRGINDDDYPDENPTGADVALVIEVSDATLRTDRAIKRRIYARAGIPVYWIVNLVDRQIEVFSEPQDGSYQKQQVYAETSIIPVVIEQVQITEIAVRDLLP